MAVKVPIAGSVFEIDTAGGSSWSAVTDIIAITLGDAAMEAPDVTVLASTSAVREFLGGGFKDMGMITVEHFWHKTMFGTWRTAFMAGTAITYRFSAPTLSGEATPTRINGSAIITRLGMPQKSKDGNQAYTFETDLKLTGVQTFTAGS